MGPRPILGVQGHLWGSEDILGPFGGSGSNLGGFEAHFGPTRGRFRPAGEGLRGQFRAHPQGSELLFVPGPFPIVLGPILGGEQGVPRPFLGLHGPFLGFWGQSQKIISKS